MDSFEFNKFAGAVLSALLVFFAGRAVSGMVFATHHPEKPGFEVAVPEHAETTEKAEKKETVPLAVLLAKGDPGKGQSVAKKCHACHTFDSGGANKIGPNLHGVVGRPKGSVDGFAYSDALKGKGGNWDYEALNAFLHNPKGYVSGTKMAFAGVKSDQQRADLILYLRSLGGNPPPLPEPSAAAEKPAAAAAETPAAEAPKH